MVKKQKVRSKRVRKKNKKEFKIGQLIIGGIIIFLMVASILSIMLYDNSGSNNPLRYGDYEFKIGPDQLVYTTINGTEMGFRALPQQTYEVDYDPQVKSVLKNGQYLGITFDPNISIDELRVLESARFELGKGLHNTFMGVAEESDLYNKLPIFSCENASLQVPIIFLKINNSFTNTGDDSKSGRVYLSPKNPYCVVIEGSPRGVLIGKDRLVYDYYGVFDNKEE